MSKMPLPSSLLLLGLALWLSGCVGDTDNKLGAEGEVCYSDLDCRGPLLCGPCADDDCPGICTALIVHPCEQAGDHLSACLGRGDEAFVRDCEAAFGTDGLPSEGAQIYGSCVLSLTCLEINASLMMAQGPLGDCFVEAMGQAP